MYVCVLAIEIKSEMEVKLLWFQIICGESKHTSMLCFMTAFSSFNQKKKKINECFMAPTSEEGLEREEGFAHWHNKELLWLLNCPKSSMNHSQKQSIPNTSSTIKSQMCLRLLWPVFSAGLWIRKVPNQHSKWVTSVMCCWHHALYCAAGLGSRASGGIRA